MFSREESDELNRRKDGPYNTEWIELYAFDSRGIVG